MSENNASDSSLYPFDNASSLLISNHIFPHDLIDDIFVMIRNESVPLCISRITAGPVKGPDWSDSRVFEGKDLGVLTLFLADGTGTEIASLQLKRDVSVITAPIKTLNGTLCGGIKADKALYSWLYSLVKNTLYGELQVSPDALILHPNTLACVSYKGYEGLSLNGQYLGSHIHLAVQHNLKAQLDASDSGQIQFDAFGDYDETFEKTEKLQTVNGVDLKGKSLIIKSNTLGDLRVVTEDNKIALLGVTDI